MKHQLFSCSNEERLFKGKQIHLSLSLFAVGAPWLQLQQRHSLPEAETYNMHQPRLLRIFLVRHTVYIYFTVVNFRNLKQVRRQGPVMATFKDREEK